MTISTLLAYLSRVCGFETLTSFPPGHAYARTHWNGAYFDIASDLKPEQIERVMCDAISNTPMIFAHIANPTPRMQNALLAVVDARLRHNKGNAGELVNLLMAAYRSPYTLEAMPGLRRAVEATFALAPREAVEEVLAFLASMPSPFGVIEANP